MAQVIDKQITDYLPLLSKEEKKTILDYIKSYVRIKEQPERINIEQYNKEIDEAMARIDKGEYTTQEELIKESKSW
ncbi:MAG TPA: hypothetical protein PLL99_02875 [Chitinophagales bacterium]|nr:hypothetical protein [Chitinophagales bacterium]